MANNGSKWFRVEYASSIYIITNINMKHDQIKKEKTIKSTINKIALNINTIKDMFNKHNSITTDSNINKSRLNKNDNSLNINETESNKRNKFGFPIFFK